MPNDPKTTDEPSLTRPPAQPLRNVAKRSTQMVLRYLDGKYGAATTGQILSEAGLDRFFFDDDPSGYMPLELIETLFQAAIRITGDARFPYHFGRDSYRYTNPVQMRFLGMFASPSLIFQNMNVVEQNIVKTTRVKTENIGRDRFRLTVSFADNYREPPSACQNRIGSYEMMPRFFALPFATVKHPKCAFRGDPCCVYEVTVPRYPFQLWRKAAAWGAGACGLACLAAAASGASLFQIPLLGAVNLCLASSLFFLLRQAAATLKWRSDAQQTIAIHNKELMTDSKRTEFLHQLTVGLNRQFRVDEIYRLTAEALVRDYHYGSCQLWHIKDDRLVCSAAVGYAPEVLSVIRSISYRIDEGLAREDSFLSTVIGAGQTLLINDIGAATAGFTEMSREFFKLLKPSAAIMVPLMDGTTAAGMLVGLHHDGRKVNYIDRLLFEATAPVVSNSISKARLHERMEEKITARGEQIQRRELELLKAREMAIHSEKLAALGQMAAAVAHEINNPLNFLLNIMPDFRRDLEGLYRILCTGRDAVTETQRAEELKRIVDSYELDEHNREHAYVFDLIMNSLDKAKRVTNSLKIFARTARSGDSERVPLIELVNAATELIPLNQRTDIVISPSVPEAFYIEASRTDIVQVLLIVLTNAIEAMNGKGAITIHAFAEPSQLILEISDRGCGIHPDELRYVFQPYFTTKKDKNHPGLGLTVAQEIMNKYGARIEIRSLPGNGTTASLVFPAHFGIMKEAQ